MATLFESLEEPNSTSIHDALVVGLDVLSGDQSVAFVPYIRTVLPLDGFVFWVRASLLPPDRLAESGLQSAEAIEIKGSLHYASIGTMVEDENISIQKVDFAAQSPLVDFAQINANVLYVAEWQTDLGSFKFTFNNRSTYYQQAGIHHLVGDAVYPVFALQLIDNIEQFDKRQVVSNSMPIWLSMREQIPFVSLVTSAVQLYPSYMIPSNLPAPYGAVDINPSSTRALQAAPLMDRYSSRSQIVAEMARITFYGLRNDDVMDFVDYTIARSSLLNEYGIMNMPVVRDERRTQVELGALAQKKTVEFEICYQQSSTRDIARRLIETAFIKEIDAVYPFAGVRKITQLQILPGSEH